MNVIKEMKSAMPLLRRKLHEGGTEAPSKIQNAKNYVSFLKELKPEDVVKHGIKSRFMEAS